MTIFKRVTALLLSLLMVGTVLVPDVEALAAEAEMGYIANQSEVDSADDHFDQMDTDTVDIGEDEVVEETDILTSEGKINYIGVDQPYLNAPGSQKMVVSFGNGTENITDAVLTYQRADGVLYQDSAAEKQDELLLFEHSFSEDEKGIYTLLQFTCKMNGAEQTISFSDIGIQAKFGVDEAYEGYGQDLEEISVEEAEVSIVDIEADEIDTAEQAIETAIADTAESVVEKSRARSVERTRQGNVIVVLDPGHGGSDSGALGNGLQEKNLNLKIAQYCKAELERYAGVTVYMTRETDVKLGATEAEDLQARVDKAKNWGADLLVSIHINSGGAGSANGVEVYYPNSNYKPSIGEEGKGVAEQIQKELVALGLTNRGIKIRNTQNDTYADGSKQDWYGIIRRSKLAGFPGIIVEHAFIDNASDAAKLKNESFLKQCGVADATGIANYFGLLAGRWEYTDGTWKYLQANGEYLKSCWYWISSKCYYFDADGRMAADTWIGDWYVDGSGAWIPGKVKVSPGWKSISGRWKYADENGNYVTSRWLLLGSTWYHFDANGWMQTGWLKLGNVWYYLTSSGAMAVDTWVGDSYVDGSGAWVPGKIKPGWKSISGRWKYADENGNYVTSRWLLLGNTRYHFDADGWMQTGWLKLGDVWYFLTSSGAMVSNCWSWIGSGCYYFDVNGCMAADTWIGDWYVDGSGAWVPGKIKPGWKSISGRWKYADKNGNYVTSRWLLLGSTWYRFDANGWMQTGWLLLGNTWYYLTSSGAMAADCWYWVGNKCYYFDVNGYMAANTWIGDWYVDGSGAWIPGKVKLTNIMGISAIGNDKTTVVNKMVQRYIKSYAIYPAYELGQGGAESIEAFCQILYEEAVAENVKPEVVFAQSMWETGWLKFGGIVQVGQFNFAGIGALDGNSSGKCATFDTVRQGLRAQVQHLKAYASVEALKNTCVDPRFHLVKRGTAPYVEWLGQKENPSGTGWASSKDYGYNIVNLIKSL